LAARLVLPIPPIPSTRHQSTALLQPPAAQERQFVIAADEAVDGVGGLTPVLGALTKASMLRLLDIAAVVPRITPHRTCMSRFRSRDEPRQQVRVTLSHALVVNE
jgi:hypothetical protein